MNWARAVRMANEVQSQRSVKRVGTVEVSTAKHYQIANDISDIHWISNLVDSSILSDGKMFQRSPLIEVVDCSHRSYER